MRDFRLLWGGAFLSFIGSWVQTIAQGWLVYDLTGDELKLTMVAFFWMLPVSVLGPFAGALTDLWNRRLVLVLTQVVYAINALILAWTIHSGTVSYQLILVIAIVNGLVSTVEMPTRQSLISKVVPAEMMASAVPLQAMTFNLARIVGPAIGGLLLDRIGAQACYLANALSFTALIFAVSAIRADLRHASSTIQPMRDLLMEGILYTWREKRLKILFLMETTVSVFGLAYLPLLPAFAKDVLKLDAAGLGHIYTSIGVGAMTGLVLLVTLSQRPYKALIVRICMTSLALALLLVSFVQVSVLAYPLFALCGLSAIMQFNTTNTLFQLLSPEAVRGRVLAMHIWALSGAAPFALPVFGWIARELSVDWAFRIGGALVLGGAALAWIHGKVLETVDEPAVAK